MKKAAYFLAAWIFLFSLTSCGPAPDRTPPPPTPAEIQAFENDLRSYLTEANRVLSQQGEYGAGTFSVSPPVKGEVNETLC